jgi:hypothetical protein
MLEGTTVTCTVDVEVVKTVIPYPAVQDELKIVEVDAQDCGLAAVSTDDITVVLPMRPTQPFTGVDNELGISELANSQCVCVSVVDDSYECTVLG